MRNHKFKYLSNIISLLIFLIIIPPLGSAKNLCKSNCEPDYEIITNDLSYPWGLAFLDETRILISERSGLLKLIDGESIQNVETGLQLSFAGQGGLLDIKKSPNYDQDQRLYLTYSKRRKGLSTTALIRFKIESNTITNVEEIFEALPYVGSNIHYGSRITFDESGHLLLTVGDRFNYSTASRIVDVFAADPQRLDNHLGKTIRLNLDGTIPKDNPFLGSAGALPEIFTHGHRNPQGIYYNSTDGQVYIVDHGPKGGDEINQLIAGKNYGWPVTTYGKDYNDERVGVGSRYAGIEEPLHYWDPSVAPSSLLIYGGENYQNWKNSWFVTTLRERTLI
ncbi:MAG: PQQ-dependent sugar dehydrogenase, partial [bacterium]